MMIWASPLLVVKHFSIYLLALILYSKSLCTSIGMERPIFDPTPETFTWTIVPIVVETSIDSAIDGNEDPVENLSSTTSNDINFTFSGHVTPEGTDDISRGFVCVLDDGETFDCTDDMGESFTSSEAFLNLPPGIHTFTVRAFVQVSEGEIIFDPTPETFTWTIVPIVVETSIDSAIDGNEDPVENLSSTTSNDINFTFSGHVTPEGTDDISRGFVCVLDGGETFECTDDMGESFTSSEEFLNLPPGVHTFTVRAFVVVNEQPIFDTTPETFTWTIVPIVVETSIDSAIDGNEDPVENLSSTTSNDINFTFSGHVTPEGTDDISRGFVCVLDGGETFECTDDMGESFTSSEEFLNLPPGVHTFTVSAFVVVNEEPIFDTTPETFTWTIVPIVVETSIDSAIDGNEDPVENLSSTTSNDINFTFSGHVTPEGTEVDSQGFVCVLDGGETFECTDDMGESFTSSEEFLNLPPGVHTFTVRAFVVVNEQPIFDTTPETFTWTIVPIVVETSIDSAIDGNEDPVENLSSTTSNDINFTFSGHVTPEGTEVISRGFVCELDGGETFECTDDMGESFTSSEEFLNLPPGVHTFTVRAFVVVNEEPIFDTTPETFTWTIVPIVVETSIDSAIDGNEDPVENLSSTTSNDINFTFSGHVTPEGTDDISRGFVCVLDGGETFECTDDMGESFTSSEEFLNLPPGVHTFTVRAFVVVNEQPIFDTTPETFTWTIVPIVVETSIDSAIDGNEDPVENLSSTTSNDIEFDIFWCHEILRYRNLIDRGFVCELDDGETFECTDDMGELFTSSEEFLNLPPGVHTFTVRAFVEVSE